MRRSGLRRRLQAAALIGGLLLAIIAVACGGDDDADLARDGATSVPPGAVAESNVGGVAALDRFHYVATLTIQEQFGGGRLTITTEGDFQHPDRHDFVYLTDRDGNQLKRAVVIIGDDAWLRDTGAGEWQAYSASDPAVADILEVAFSTARARFLSGDELARVRDSVRTLPSTVETVNGVEADHYTVGEAGREYFESFLAGDGAPDNVVDYTWDLWLATDGGWPVRLQASATITGGAGFLDALDLAAPATYELSLDVSRPDDPTIEIVPPVN